MRSAKFVVLTSLAAMLLISAPPARSQSAPAADPLEPGLVQALDNIGRILLGDEGFSANLLTVDSITGVQISLAETGPVPIWVNVMVPPSPCHPALRLLPDPTEASGLRILYDPSVLPAPVLVAASLAAPPGPCSQSPRLSNGPLRGLVSVGRTLFGRDSFDAYTADIAGTSTLLFYFRESVSVPPAFIDISVPPSPCHAGLRILTGGSSGGTVIQYDPAVLPVPPAVVSANIVDHPPGPCGTEIVP